MVHHSCYLILSRHRECIVVGPARSGAASGPNSSVGFVGTLPRAGLPSSGCSLGGGGLAAPHPRWPWRPSACTLRVARGQAFCAQEGGEGREGVTGFGWTWLRFRIWENHIWEPFAEAGTDWGNSAAKGQKSKMPMWMFFLTVSNQHPQKFPSFSTKILKNLQTSPPKIFKNLQISPPKSSNISKLLHQNLQKSPNFSTKIPRISKLLPRVHDFLDRRCRRGYCRCCRRRRGRCPSAPACPSGCWRRKVITGPGQRWESTITLTRPSHLLGGRLFEDVDAGLLQRPGLHLARTLVNLRGFSYK